MSTTGQVIFGKTAAGVNLPVLVGNDGALVAGLTVGDITLGTVSINQTTPGTTNGVVINSSALPTGAATQATLADILAKIIAAPATEAAQTTGNGTLSTINGKITACNTGAVVISSSALPSGAATAAKQPALGTAGTASADVITVQGVANGTALPVSGSVTNTPVALSRDSSNGYVASEVVKASAGSLFSVIGYNSGPTQFIQVHNTTSLPSAGAVPILLLVVPAASSFAFDFGGLGLPCSTGITLATSSTGPTLTVGSANVFFTSTFL